MHQSHELGYYNGYWLLSFSKSFTMIFHLEEIKLLIIARVNTPDLDISAWICTGTLHVPRKSRFSIHDIIVWIAWVGINWWMKHPPLIEW